MRVETAIEIARPDGAFLHAAFTVRLGLELGNLSVVPS